MTAPIPPAPGNPEAGSLRIFRRVAYLLGARWFRELLQTVFVIILARLSTTTFGEFMLALGLGNILLQAGEFGLNLSLTRLLSERDRDPAEVLRLVTLLKGTLLAAAWLGALVFLAWQGYPAQLWWVLLVIGTGVGLEALASTFFVALQVEGRQKREGQVRALAATLGFGYGLVTLALGAPPLVVAFFKLVETLANLAGGLALARPRLRLMWHWPHWPRLWEVARYGVVFALVEVAASIFNRANLFFLERAAGPQGVAIYSAPAQTVEGFANLASALLLQSVLFPLFIKLWHTDRQAVSHLAQNTARGLMAAGALLSFFLYFESDRIMLWVFGPQYLEAVALQKVLVPTIMCSYLYNLAGFLLMSMRLERLLLACYLAAAAFNLVFCAVVIPRLPLLGAALAIVCTKALLAVITLVFCQSLLKVIPWKSAGEILAAGLLGTGLYLVSTGHMLRGFAEGLAMLPILGLAWRWWRHRELGGGTNFEGRGQGSRTPPPTP